MTTPTPSYPYAPQPAPFVPGPAPQAPGARTNPLAIIGLVAAFLAPVVGLVLGVVARRQVSRTGENGRGMATAAIVLGPVFSAVWIAMIAVVIAAGGAVSASVSTTPSVPASSVETQIVAQAGLPAGSVSCPDSLPATLGAATTCTVTQDGTATPVDVTVTSVNGDDVGFRFTQR